MQNVIKRFILARKALALTQAEMAASLGFKQSYISNIEKGRNEVTSNIIIALYKLYSISPDWLITGEGEMLSKHPSRTGIPLPEDVSLPAAIPIGPIVGNPVTAPNQEPWIESLQTTIKTQQTTILLQEMIKMLEDELNRAKSKLSENISS